MSLCQIIDYCFESLICLNIHAMTRHMIKFMLGSIPHQKLFFYHLPTQGRAGIKLGDADTSPSYL